MEEFYPADRWPNTRVKKPSIFRRLWCLWSGGHQWCLHFGTNMYNHHEYCQKCWLFRHDETTCPCDVISQDDSFRR